MPRYPNHNRAIATLIVAGAHLDTEHSVPRVPPTS